jgi:dihydroorotate dehydrogenase
MPDWFYRTVSRPILFRLPAEKARDLALGLLGGLARLPLGPAVIDFLGHMRADPRLRRSFAGVDFPTVIGLGPDVDARVVALPALGRFGFGFVEIGPVTPDGSAAAAPINRRPDQQSIWLPDPPRSLSLPFIKPKVEEAARLGLPIIVRLGHRAADSADSSAAACRQIIQELAAEAQLFSLLTLRLGLARGWSSEQWTNHLQTILDAARNARPVRPVLVCLPADLEMYKAEPLLDAAQTAGVGGFLVDGSVRAEADGRLIGLPARRPASELVRHLRRRYGPDLLLVGSGGIHGPEDVLALQSAGADLVQIDSGLVYSGPGLPKRINEVLLFAATRPEQHATSEPSRPESSKGVAAAPTPFEDSGRATRAESGAATERPAEMTWFWTALMGGGMLFGSILALVIAATRVVLPYDEAFAGMSRADFAAVNPRLLAFMAHDRVSLAGTMVAIGVMYVGLSLYGVRCGLHWARQSIFFSAFTGFASFFLFLGFGYLDPFHAFVTAALLQLLLLGIHCRLGTYLPALAPPLCEDRAWRLGLWGQLLLIIHGFALLAAGAAISLIGVTEVFVPEDLAFMGTTAHALRSANPRLVPVVAHDRATFGGMILAAGWVFLLPALWGFQRGASWLWWTLLIAGLPAYAAAIGVHYAVGYLEPMHLLPAFLGLGLFSLGLGLSYRHFR